MTANRFPVHPVSVLLMRFGYFRFAMAQALLLTATLMENARRLFLNPRTQIFQRSSDGVFERYRNSISAILLLGMGSFISFPAIAGSFVDFESGQTRPLALSPDGTRLYAVNTPDNRLEIFYVNAGMPKLVTSVTVGMEPVAVAVRGNNEVWVEWHLT